MEPARAYGHHVEPDGDLVHSPQEGERRPPQAVPLGRSDRLLRGPVGLVGPESDLDEHKRGAVTGDDVDLTTAPPPVAGNDPHPHCLQVPTGDVLRLLSVHLSLILARTGRNRSKPRILPVVRILIRGAAVVQRAENAVLPNADVIVDGRRYEAVVPHGGVTGVFERTIEGEGCLLVPGLVNAHTHLAMTLFRGVANDLPLERWLTEEIWPREQKLTAKDIYWGALLGLAEMIQSGTTAFVDMYFRMEEVAQAVEEAGLRALLSYGIVAPTPDRIEPEIRLAEAFAHGWDGGAGGRIRAALSPHAPYTCLPEVWRRVTALAHELHVPIHTHLAETAEEVARIRTEQGKSPAEWLEELGVFSVPVIAAHCVHVSEKDIEILAAHGASVAHCPTSNLRLACGIAPVQAMLDGGVNVALGTDGAASAGDLNLIEEMRLASLVAKHAARDPQALPAAEALRCATSRGAAALGLSKELGTIEAGRRADGVLIRMTGPHLCPSYDPLANLVYAAQGLDVEAVFVDGKPLLLGGEFQTLDVEEIEGRCRQISRRFR